MNVLKLLKNVKLELGAGGKPPPTEFRIFAFGEVDTSKGTFTFDAGCAAAVMAAYEDQGNELCLDYEHAMLEDPPPPAGAPAAGWYKLAVREDGLYAVDVKWTPRALEYLANGEYRYFSPAFSDDDDGRILHLVNIALTNLPATKDMTPLVAAKAVPFKSGTVVEGEWDASAAEKRLRKWASSDGSGDKDKVDFKKYEKAFAYVSDDGEHFGDFHLPHHDIEDDKLVVSKRGVQAAAAAAQGSRGGADIPAEDLAGVKAHLAKHYHQWGEKAPWESDAEKATDRRTDAVKLSMSFDQIRDALADALRTYLAGRNLYGWICDVYDASVVFCVENKLFQAPYSLEGNRAVIGDATEVQRTYTPVANDEPETPMKTLLTALSLKADASEAEALSALSRKLDFEREVLALTGKTSTSEAIGAIAALKDDHGKVAALTAELQALKAEKTEAEVNGLVDAALREGKLTPARKDWALGLGRKDVAMLKGFLDTATAMPAATPPAREPAPGTTAPGAPPVQLSAEELHVAQLLKNDPKKLAEMKGQKAQA